MNPILISSFSSYIIFVFITSSVVQSLGMGDGSGALTGILLAKLLSSSNDKSHQAPKPPILIPPRICIQRVPVPVPFPVQVPVKVKDESRPPVIQLPPNIIHNFIPPPQNKYYDIDRRPRIQHFYPKPEVLPPIFPVKPAPEPEPERIPHGAIEKTVSEDSELNWRGKIDASQILDPNCIDPLFKTPFVPGPPPPSLPFVPGLGYPNPLAPGYPAGFGYPSGMGYPMGMGFPPQPTQTFNHVGQLPQLPIGLPQQNWQPAGKICHQICHKNK